MSKESMLQKDFKESDVRRMRNLITKKFNDSTKTQLGYKKIKKDYQEGDIWDENGKTWTIQDGIKMTISKLDEVKTILQIPLTCPQCGKPMKNNLLNKKIYSYHNQCFDCYIVFETKLKQEGKFDEYVRDIMKANVYSYISDLDQVFEEFISDESFTRDTVTEAGDIENWRGGHLDKEKMKKEFQEYIEKLKTSFDK